MRESEALSDQDPSVAAPAAPATPPRLSCHAIAPADLDEVVALLGRGFPERSAAYWRAGFARHGAHPIPKGCPDLGYLMRADGRAVGVVLTLYAPPGDPNASGPRCNLSSWYVEPAFRPFATLLDRVAMRRREATYTNISAAPHTVAMHEARGFTARNAGQYVGVPLLAPPAPGRTVMAASPARLAELPAHEARLLAHHMAYGCICVVGRHGAETVPFVFIRHPVRWLRWRLGFSPLHYLQLVYGRDTASVAAFARSLGRYLLRHHGAACVAMDADGPLPGWPGRFIANMDRRLARGPDPVRAGDLSYSEMVIFGA